MGQKSPFPSAMSRQREAGVGSARALLAERIGSEGTDPLEGEGEENAVLVTETGVESHILDIETAAIPGPAERGGEVDQLPLAGEGVEAAIPQVITEVDSSVGPPCGVAEEGREVDLVSREGAGIKALLVDADPSSDVPILTEGDKTSSNARTDDDVSETVQLGIVVDSQIPKEKVVRTPAGPEIDRGDLPEGAAEGESGEGIDRKELVADSFTKSSTKCRIEKIFLLDGDVEQLVRLRSLPLPKDTADEKAVADTEGEFVRAGDDVAFIDP